MKENSQSISDLNIIPMNETQQMQIKGGTTADDKRHPRPGGGTTTTTTSNSTKK